MCRIARSLIFHREDVQQAKNNLYEAIHINIEETQKMGTFEKFLEEGGLECSASVKNWLDLHP